jgi:hypothetical protein
MNSIQEHGNTLGKVGCVSDWASHLPAVLFNTGFAILAIITLCGIVFVTKPKGVMHDISPEMWLPLLIVMVPAQIYAQFLSWSTVFAGQIPTGLAIASRQVEIPGFLKPLVSLVWLCNFCIGFAIVVSLSKPHPGKPPPSVTVVSLVMIVGSWLAFAAIVYLLLAFRTCTQNEYVLHRIWNLRIWIGLTMGACGAIYYGL